MEKHLRVLSVLFIVYGSLHLLASMAGWVFMRWSGLAHTFNSGEMYGRYAFLSGIVAILLFFVFLVSIGCIIGGIGLLNRRRWARVLVLVLSFLALIHFPLGTALGIYGIWVLMKDETDAYFAQTPTPVAQQRVTGGDSV
jgi:hypothetical protein